MVSVLRSDAPRAITPKDDPMKARPADILAFVGANNVERAWNMVKRDIAFPMPKVMLEKG